MNNAQTRNAGPGVAVEGDDNSITIERGEYSLHVFVGGQQVLSKFRGCPFTVAEDVEDPALIAVAAKALDQEVRT